MVASHHYAVAAINSGKEVGLLMKLLSTQGGFLGVSIFFFLSGYGLMYSTLSQELNFKSFIKRRLTKVYLPAVFISLLWVLIIFFFPTLQDVYFGLTEMVDLSNLPAYLLGVFAFKFCDSVLWFVKVIFVLYLLLYVYLATRKKRKGMALLTLLIGLICVTIATYYYIAPFASVSIFAFALGALVAEYKSQVVKIKYWYLSLIVVICALGYFLRCNHLLLHGLINYCILFLALFFFSCFDVKCNISSKWVTNLSYDLYLSHNKVKVVMLSVFPTMNLMTFLLLSVIVAVSLTNIRKFIRLL